MIHSDQGWHYQHCAFVDRLKANGYYSEHIQKMQLPRQQQDGDFFLNAQAGDVFRA